MTDDISTRDADSRWIRLPANGQRCPVSGLPKTTLLDFVKEFGVKSALLRRPGRTRGVRLIDRASLLAAIEKMTVGPTLPPN